MSHREIRYRRLFDPLGRVAQNREMPWLTIVKSSTLTPRTHLIEYRVSHRLQILQSWSVSIAKINDGKLIMKFDGEQAAPEGAAFALGLKEVA